MSSIQGLLFNPVDALSSGLILSLCVLFFFLFFGRVLGISGILGELISPSSKEERVWRSMFIGGLVLIGLSFKSLVDFELSKYEATTAGFLVGFGTTLGSGCTSGHGLCGLARLSVRSIAAVATFMLSGMITRVLLVKENESSIPIRSSFEFDNEIAYGLVGIFFFLLVSSLFGNRIPSKFWKLSTDLSSLIIGLFFGFGLIKSGMTNPNKVKSFLALPAYFGFHPKGLIAPFDGSLAFVMMGGMLPNLLFIPYVLRKYVRPIYAEKWQIPTRTRLDWSLLLGSAIFGVGWAIGGICPGPGVVVAIPRLLSGKTEMLHWWIWFIIGVKFAKVFK